MAAVEPRGDNGGDEELGAVRVYAKLVKGHQRARQASVPFPELAMPADVSELLLVRWESVQLTEKTLLGVLELEVLVRELLAVDGLATGAVAVGEVTTLNHEALDHTVEGRALVTEALLASSKSPVPW